MLNKSRLGLACFFATVCCLLCARLYKTSTIEVEFLAKGTGDSSIAFQVFYTETDGEKFNGNKVVTQKAVLNSDYRKVKLLLPVKYIERFRLDVGTVPGNITIKNLKIKGDKTVYLLQGKTDVHPNQIDSYKIENDILELNSSQKDPYFIWKRPLKLKHGIEIDGLLLFSVFALSCLAGWQLAGMILKIKTRIPAADVALLIVVCAVLFVPMSKIDRADKSVTENRMLAKRPSLITKNGMNLKYGRDFEAWFNDRFNGRKRLQSLWSVFKNFINSRIENNKAMMGKDGFIFLKLDNGIQNWQNKILYNKKQLNSILMYLDEINSFCKKNRKKFYLFIAPDKNKIYGEYFSTAYKKLNDDRLSRTYQLVDYIKSNSDINVIYPRDNLLSAKKDGLLYWKNDTHWNQYGAFIGYQALWDEMKKDFPELPSLNVEFKLVSYPKGDLNSMIYTRKGLYENIKYKHLTVQSDNCVDTKSRDSVHCVNKDNKINLFSLRDSFSKSMLDYYYMCFRESVFEWRREFKLSDEQILKQSDIIVFEIVERYLPYLENQKVPDFMRK